MLHHISKCVTATLVTLVSLTAVSTASVEAAVYRRPRVHGRHVHAHRVYRPRSYHRHSVYRRPCYEKVIIEYQTVREPYTEYVTVVDEYGYQQRVRKTFYREVQVPVKRIVTVCP